MVGNTYGVSAYQQMNQTWKKESTKSGRTESAGSSESAKSTAQSTRKAQDVEFKKWSPIDTSSSLVPVKNKDYGMSIGDVNLSDEAKDYYSKLKSKFGNAEFILVDSDMKSQVPQNAAAYGNSNKMVILIDEEKLERMATDESYRKKYEGIIAMSQTKMASAKNSLASSGANITNFGMSVNSDGTTNFFATVEKSNDAQTKLLEKKAEAKKEQKAKEKKKAEKEAAEERLEKQREKKRADKKEQTEKLEEAKAEKAEAAEEKDTVVEAKEYISFEAGTLDELVSKVQNYAYDRLASGVMTAQEQAIGQQFDFKG